MLLLLLAICIAPVAAAYLVFHVFPPSGRTNYGELITPRPPPPGLTFAAAGGEPYSLEALRGRWVLLHTDSAACDDACARKLFMIRQLRTMTGKERSRIERVWLISDAGPIDPRLLEPYQGTVMVRADRERLAAWLEVPAGQPIERFIFLVDPLGNLMMRYASDSDPTKVRKDLGKLLKSSWVG